MSNQPEILRRNTIHKVGIEKRMDGDKESHVVRGLAARFNSRTDLFWFEEEIIPGAFDEVLTDDVRALFNHDPNLILARSPGTLSLSVDADGLWYEYETPDISYARDLAVSLERGDITQSSFAFSIAEETWVMSEDEKDLRQITKVARLYDVSPVTYPAYQDTEVSLKSDTTLQEVHQRAKELNAQPPIPTPENILKPKRSLAAAQIQINNNKIT